MKKKYDFSKGTKGRFYFPEEKIELPFYLDQKNQNFYLKLASAQEMSISQLINSLLKKEKDILFPFLKNK